MTSPTTEARSAATPTIAVTVLGQDRPGIVADVTRALADLHGNLEDSTMTLLRGHFAMVVLVRTTASVHAVESALSRLTADGTLVVNARVLGPAPEVPTEAPTYALHVHGADRPGIVARITGVVARHQANIVDLGTRLTNGLYVLVAELQLPAGASLEALQADLALAARELGVDARVEVVEDDLL